MTPRLLLIKHLLWARQCAKLFFREGHLARSVGGASDPRSQDDEFESRTGDRDDFKSNEISLRILFIYLFI